MSRVAAAGISLSVILLGARIPATPAPADATDSRVLPVAHRVQLRIGMQGQRFSPARVVATVGDSLLFELESDGPHNVGFDPDSIPAGALELLARRLGTDARYLVTPEMLIDRGETFLLPLDGLPPGRYVFYCTPHLGNGMRGELVLQAPGAASRSAGDGTTGAPRG